MPPFRFDVPIPAPLVRWVRTAAAPPGTTRVQAVDRMERVAAMTHLLSSLEHLATPAQRRHGGLNNWAVSRDSLLVKDRRVRAGLDVVARPAVTVGLHCARVAAAAVLLAPHRHRAARTTADLTLAGTSLILHPRHHYGTDGSDQVAFFVQWASALARGAGERHRVVDAALWTVSASASMSYAVSGWAKLAGTTWRQGRALTGVTRTLTYGDRRTWQLLTAYPRTARAMGAAVLALECSFPLAYVGSGRLARSYVVSAAAMHLSIARIMALGRFVPAFTSMHPAVLYTARSRASTQGPDGPSRDDTVPHLLALGGVVLASAAALARSRNRRLVTGGRGDELTLRTRSGAALTYRTLDGATTDGPLFVLENGLLSTVEHWDWVAMELSRHGAVVTYNRSGYAGSSPSTGPRSLSTAVDDAVDLVDALAAGRDVVLVGHSLGGYIALRTAERTSAHVAAVALVDSSHPDELRRSSRQSHGADSLTAAFPLMIHSLDLGLGMLLDVPAWVRSLPADARTTALAQYRDSRMWKAARREWDHTLAEFGAGPELRPLAAAVIALTADRSVDQDPEHGVMQAELSNLGNRGRHEVVRGADHDSILSNESTATEVARRIIAFLRPDRDPPTAHDGAQLVDGGTGTGAALRSRAVNA